VQKLHRFSVLNPILAGVACPKARHHSPRPPPQWYSPPYLVGSAFLTCQTQNLYPSVRVNIVVIHTIEHARQHLPYDELLRELPWRIQTLLRMSDYLGK